MTCTKCGSHDTKVKESRNADAPTYYDNSGRAKSRVPLTIRPLLGATGRWRRHRCTSCNNQFDTIELPVREP